MGNWQIETNTGVIINVPRDRPRNNYEDYRRYGFQSALERMKRSRILKKLQKEDPEVSIHAIIFPDGEYVTQF